MPNVSSKFTHLSSVEAFLKDQADAGDSYHNGIMLLTNFGIIYGKFSDTDPNDNHNVSNLILNIRDKALKNEKNSEVSLIGDGSSIVLEDAVIKYSNNIIINMSEIIVFCDQIVGYYPVDLSKLSEQLH